MVDHEISHAVIRENIVDQRENIVDHFEIPLYAKKREIIDRILTADETATYASLEPKRPFKDKKTIAEHSGSNASKMISGLGCSLDHRPCL